MKLHNGNCQLSHEVLNQTLLEKNVIIIWGCHVENVLIFKKST